MKTIIFDLDGTLLDSIKDLASCTNYMLRKYNFPEHPIDAYKYFVGNGMKKLVERALPEEKRTEEFIEHFEKDFIEYYDVHKEDFTEPYKGISELLQYLNNQDCCLAVASNKINEATRQLIKKYFPSINFTVVLGQREGIPTKPNKQIILDILKETGSSLEETYMIGDTSVDIQTAKNAQIGSIGVLWGFRTYEELENAGADSIVQEPQEIIKVLGFTQ